MVSLGISTSQPKVQALLVIDIKLQKINRAVSDYRQLTEEEEIGATQDNWLKALKELERKTNLKEGEVLIRLMVNQEGDTRDFFSTEASKDDIRKRSRDQIEGSLIRLESSSPQSRATN
jgi:hypothetical protein